MHVLLIYCFLASIFIKSVEWACSEKSNKDFDHIRQATDKIYLECGENSFIFFLYMFGLGILLFFKLSEIVSPKTKQQ